MVVYDDYGHHPTAIRGHLEAARQREPERRIWGLRAADLPSDRGDARRVRGGAREADAVAIADIWASRDPDTTITLGCGARGRRPPATPRHPRRRPGLGRGHRRGLARNVADGDAVLVMGGGKSYRIAELLLEALEAAG